MMLRYIILVLVRLSLVVFFCISIFSIKFGVSICFSSINSISICIGIVIRFDISNVCGCISIGKVIVSIRFNWSIVNFVFISFECRIMLFGGGGGIRSVRSIVFISKIGSNVSIVDGIYISICSSSIFVIVIIGVIRRFDIGFVGGIRNVSRSRVGIEVFIFGMCVFVVS